MAILISNTLFSKYTSIPGFKEVYLREKKTIIMISVSEKHSFEYK